ncbi:MAG: 2-C-methyl-D-erythritol 4-phosphate cytidylyltransferase [Bacteroidota bacterium]
MKKSAIIVAGGTGTRMKSDVPKQFLLIDEVPILVHTIRKFLTYDGEIQLVVVLPESHLQQWQFVKSQYFPDVEIIATNGGETRSASVLSGLLFVKEGLVAVHDAVRPFVSVDTIAKSFESAEEKGSGVAAVQLKDSIRELANESSIARDRANYVLVQTPQTFDSAKLQEAYRIAGVGSFTDDASVYEAAGNKVHLIYGTYENIKITTPEDLR